MPLGIISVELPGPPPGSSTHFHPPGPLPGATWVAHGRCPVKITPLNTALFFALAFYHVLGMCSLAHVSALPLSNIPSLWPISMTRLTHILQYIEALSSLALCS